MIENPDGIVVGEKAPTTKIWNCCGQEGPEWYFIVAFGEQKRIMNDGCPACLVPGLMTYAIRCASCGLLIHHGNDGVSARVGPLAHKHMGTLIADNIFACCMRVGCYVSGSHAGSWTKQGFVPNYKGGTIAWHSLNTENSVLVGAT